MVELRDSNLETLPQHCSNFRPPSSRNRSSSITPVPAIPLVLTHWHHSYIPLRLILPNVGILHPEEVHYYFHVFLFGVIGMMEVESFSSFQTSLDELRSE